MENDEYCKRCGKSRDECKLMSNGFCKRCDTIVFGFNLHDCSEEEKEG